MAILGDNTIGTINDTGTLNVKTVGSPVVAPESGIVTSMTGYVSGSGPGIGNQVLRAIIYEDNGGVPGQLIGFSDEVTITDTVGFSWVTFPFSSTPPLIAGHSYRFGYIPGAVSDGTQLKAFSGTGVRYNTDTYSDGPSNPFGTATSFSLDHYSLYATYTPSAVLSAANSNDTAWGGIRLGAHLTTESYGSAGNPSMGSVISSLAPYPPPPGGGGVVMADLKGLNVYKESDLAAIAALGVKHVRCDFSLAEISFPNFYSTCRTLGIKVDLNADYARGFGTNGDHSNPSNHTTWANTIAAGNWRNNLDVVEALACWNEPWLGTDNLQGFWNPVPDPAAYYDLLTKLTVAVWNVAPNMTILWSADYNANRTVVGYADPLWRAHLLTLDTSAGLLSNSKLKPEIHCYCQINAPTALANDVQNGFQRWKFAYDDVKAHGHPDPKCWVTEWGWETNLAGDTGPGGGSPNYPVTEQQQSDYHVSGYNLMLASGKVERSHSFYYQLSNTWSYNWLKVNNTQKLVCAAVAAL